MCWGVDTMDLVLCRIRILQQMESTDSEICPFRLRHILGSVLLSDADDECVKWLCHWPHMLRLGGRGEEASALNVSPPLSHGSHCLAATCQLSGKATRGAGY